MAFNSEHQSNWDELISNWLSSETEELQLDIDNYECHLRWLNQVIICSISLDCHFRDKRIWVEDMLKLSLPSLQFFNGALTLDPDSGFYCLMITIAGDSQVDQINRAIEALVNQCEVWRDLLNFGAPPAESVAARHSTGVRNTNPFVSLTTFSNFANGSNI